MAKTLSVTIPTADNFKAFGAVISNENKNPDGGDENFNWWERLGLFQGIEALSVNILEAKKRALTINTLEYHEKTPEAIIPMGGEEVILVVAPAGKLDENEIKAFKLNGRTGVVLHPGVRHFIPYPVSKNVNCLIVFKDATGANDLIFDKLSDMYQIVV